MCVHPTEEKKIFEWIQSNIDILANTFKDKNPRVHIQEDCDEIWNDKGVPEDIDHPGANFFRNKPMSMIINHKLSSNMEYKNNFQENFFQFESSPGEQPKSSLSELLTENDPLSSIIKPIDDAYFQDPRYNRNPICDKKLSFYKLSFESINANCVFLEPIILNIFLFDAKIGKRVSEVWSFVPNQFHELLVNNEALSHLLKAPTSVKIAINRPTEKKYDSFEQSIDKLFLVCIFDRFFMKQGGAAVDAYYVSPKEMNEKKAILAIKETNPNGWKTTFAYSAHPISKILETSGTLKKIQFLKVISTEVADEAFLFHKLNKERKKPKFIPIDARFSLDKAEPDEEIYQLRYYYNTNPFFRLKFQNEILVRIKTINISAKFGVKCRNIVADISCRQGDKDLEILNHGNSYKTHCQYHNSNPSFYDEFILCLPYPLTDDVFIDFKLFHIESKAQASGETNIIGTASISLLQNEHIICDGEHKINVIDPTGKSLEQKSSITLEVLVNSSIQSSNPSISKMLQGDYTNLDSIDFFSIAKFLEPLLDQIIKDISEGNEKAFNALLLVLSKVPCNEKDYRYTGKIKEAYQDCEVLPHDLIHFYIQKCALHNVDHEKFFKYFLQFYFNYCLQTTDLEKRLDILSSFFVLDIFLKCIILDKTRIENEVFQNLIRTLHKSIISFRSDKYSISYIGYQLNTSLALFYKDLCEFCDRGYLILMVYEHISELEVTRGDFERRCLIDFLGCFLSEKSLLILCIPLVEDNFSSCAFSRIFLQTFEELLKEEEQIHKFFAILYSILTHFNQDELKIVAKGLTPIIDVLGRNFDIINNYKNTSLLILPFIVVLFILSRLDFSKQNSMIAKTCRIITQMSNRGMSSPLEMKELEGFFEGSVYTNINSLKLVEKAKIKSATINTHQVWKIIAFLNQIICIKFIESCNTADSFNDILIPLFNVNVSNSLFQMLRDFTMNFIENNKVQVFKNSQYKIYKLVLFLVKNLSEYNVEIINKIWNCEEIECKTNNRTTAFFMYGIKKYGLEEFQFQNLKNSKVYPIAERFMQINNELKKYNEKDESHHDLIADCLLEMANFYIPSPDCRVQVLLELAQLHLQYQYASEAAVAQLTAAALVAEYLRVLGRLPNVFSDSEHPAKSFISACPSASKEICSNELMNDLPKIPGFCTTKYFCECGLIFIIQTSMDTCKRAQLFELSTKVHSLLRPLIEYRHLWRILEKHFQNGELSWSFLEQFGTKTDRLLGTYFKVEYQTGEIYIYREAQLINLWQFSAKIKMRLAMIADGKEIVICNDGAELNPEKFEEGKFYIHIKAVEQYFTPEERKMRVTVFEQNHNVDKFYFDLPYSKTAQSSIEHCYLKRTIFKLPNPIPYIVSRVRIPNENIEQIDFTPIEYSCQNLQKQVDNITDATKRKDFPGLQLLLQGSLLVQVNEGPKKVAETFLTGAREDNNTATLRKIFREFLKANEAAVKLLQEEFIKTDSVFKKLQEEMEIGLSRLSSALQPFLK